MPKVTIDHKSSLNPSDAYQKIKAFFESDQDIRRLDSNLSCQFNDSSLTGKAKGSQFNADISIKGEGSGCQVLVIVDLPLLLTPFKGKVQETISKKLNKYLA